MKKEYEDMTHIKVCRTQQLSRSFSNDDGDGGDNAL